MILLTVPLVTSLADVTHDEMRLLLGEDDGDGVVEDALAKHQHVEDRVHVEGVKDGDSSHGVHG